MKLWRNWQIGVGNSSFWSVAWGFRLGSAWTWCMMTRLNIVFMVIFDPRKLKNLMTSCSEYGFQRKISYFMQFQSRKLWRCSRKSWETKRSAVWLCNVQYYWWKWVICGFPGFPFSATTKLGPLPKVRRYQLR